MEAGPQRRVVGPGQRHETVGAGAADQRIGPGEVDVVGDRDERGRRPFRVQAAGGVGEEQRLAAERLNASIARAWRRGRRARSSGRGPETGRRALALDLADDEPPGVALDGRDRKAGDVDVRDGDRVSASSARAPRPEPSTMPSGGSVSRPRLFKAPMAASGEGSIARSW